MAVTIRGGAIHLLYDPGFVTRCTPDELANVLLHETHHILFGHLLADPGRFPDRRARVIAEEVTVNEWIPGPLPGRPIRLADYPTLPVDEDTDTRYRRLAGRPGKGPEPLPPTGCAPKGGGSARKSAPAVPNPGPPGSDRASAGQKSTTVGGSRPGGGVPGGVSGRQQGAAAQPGEPDGPDGDREAAPLDDH